MALLTTNLRHSSRIMEEKQMGVFHPSEDLDLSLRRVDKGKYLPNLSESPLLKCLFTEVVRLW